jgi:hypothetical protein
MEIITVFCQQLTERTIKSQEDLKQLINSVKNNNK